MKSIKIMNISNGGKGNTTRMIVLDNEVFDWGLDPVSLSAATKTIEQNPDMRESVVSSVVEHFLDCFADFCGREITLEEVMEAIEQGEMR